MNTREAANIEDKIVIEILKTPEATVYFIKSTNIHDKEIIWLFSDEEYEIIFNKEWIIKSPQIEVLITCFYESRHAYLFHSIKNEINESKEILKQ